jgi:hypothetical protein
VPELLGVIQLFRPKQTLISAWIAAFGLCLLTNGAFSQEVIDDLGALYLEDIFQKLDSVEYFSGEVVVALSDTGEVQIFASEAVGGRFFEVLKSPSGFSDTDFDRIVDNDLAIGLVDLGLSLLGSPDIYAAGIVDFEIGRLVDDLSFEEPLGMVAIEDSVISMINTGLVPTYIENQSNGSEAFKEILKCSLTNILKNANWPEGSYYLGMPETTSIGTEIAIILPSEVYSDQTDQWHLFQVTMVNNWSFNSTSVNNQSAGLALLPSITVVVEGPVPKSRGAINLFGGVPVPADFVSRSLEDNYDQSFAELLRSVYYSDCKPN